MGTEARTRLALGALLVVTLLSFGQVFDRGEYPGPALLGMIAAGIIAAGARRIGIGTGLTLLGSAAGLLWYVVLVFQARNSFYGLPTTEALRGLLRSVQNAYDASLVDYAPVPVRPGYVMLTVAALWIATTIGEIATFRWRRPLLASLPCVGLFAFLSVVGTRSGTTMVVVTFLAALLTFWAVESSHRLRSWGRWVAGLGGRGAGDASEISSRLARRMGGAALVAAIAAPAFLPALGDGLLSWRSGRAGDGAPFGTAVGGRIDLLASLRPTLVNQTGEELFYVRATRPSYWRLESLVEFDGATWRPLEGLPEQSALGGIATEGQPRIYTIQEQRYEIVGLQGEAMPAAVQAARVDVTEPIRSRSEEDATFHFRTGSLEMRGGLVPGLGYEVTSFVPDVTFRELRNARIGTTDPIYTEAPPVSAAVAALVERWTRGARSGTPVDQLLAIQERLRRFTYSTEVESLASSDYLSLFLLETRTGYCQQFAAAFALLARHLGFPARVSVGFLPGETTVSAPDRYIVRGTHAHAWPEVFFEGYGWIAFEPTPRDLAAPPVYTTPPRQVFQADNPFSDIPGQGGAGRNPRFLEGNQNVPTGGRDVRRGAEPPAGDGSLRRYAWEDTFAAISRALLILLIAALVAIPTLKSLRTWAAYRAAGGPDDLAGAAFRHFEREAADLASGRGRAESAARFAHRLGSSYRVPSQPATRLARLYERAEYGAVPLPENLAAEAKRLALDLRTRLWASASWWERARRLFSPRGLAGP